MLLMLQATPSGTSKLGETPFDRSPYAALVKTPTLSEIGSPATPSSSVAAFFDVPVSPLLTRPTPLAKEMLASLPAYIKWEAGPSVVSLTFCCVQGLSACVYTLWCRLT